MTLSLPRLIDTPALGPRPFLTWYGADGERIELSATVTANWVAKTTNLLVEEFDAGPGTLVRLDLPVHWRTAVWAIAVWRTGAGVVLGGSGAGPADVIITDRPAALEAPAREGAGVGSTGAGGAGADVAGVDGAGLDGAEVARAEIVAQVLPSLARSFDGELPPGAMDAARAVGSYSDVIGYVPPAEPSSPAVQTPDGTVSHGSLGSWAAKVPVSARLGVGVDGSSRDVEGFLRLVLGALSASSSLVLLPETHPDPSRVLGPEHATAFTVGPEGPHP